ncbi:MAG: aminoacyl-tRNA hydrolase [Chloroflexi bacterium]|nr:aminoacyl-tRNA hydrolase [Chloroflexota bacterium]
MNEVFASPHLIVGLGNPGRSYVHTRHNVGFDCVELLARDLGIGLGRRERQARVGEGVWEGQRLLLALPQTYMNLSGLAVSALLRKHRVPLSNLLVVYDEMDLPLGAVRIRERGSAGGHHGMESIIASLGSQDFPRLRIGISRAGERGADVEYVLSRFTSGERAPAQEAIARAVAAIKTLLVEGIAAAMDRFNRRPDE